MKDGNPPTTGHTHGIWAPVLLFSLAALLWAGNAIVGRVASEYVAPFTLSFWRWALALVLIIPFGVPRLLRERRAYLRHWRLFLLLSLLNVTAYNTFLYWALNWTTALNVGILSASMPVCIFALTWITGQERAGPYQLLGLVVALGGVLGILCRGDFTVLAASGVNFGDLLMLCAIVSFAVYSVILRRVSAQVHILGLLTFQIGAGLAGIAPFYLWEIAHGIHWQPGLPDLAILAYVGVFPSIVANLCWIKAVQSGGANLGGIMYNLMPVFISIMAVLLLGEVFGLYHAAGIGAIFAAFYLAVLKPARARPRCR